MSRKFFNISILLLFLLLFVNFDLYAKNNTDEIIANSLNLENVDVSQKLVLNVDDSVKIGLSQNPSVLMAELQKKQALGSLKTAKGQNSFSISLTTTAKQFYPKSPSTNTEQSFSNQIALTVPLYNAGKLQAGERYAQLGVESADWGQILSRIATRYQIINLYYKVTDAKALIEIQTKARDAYQKHYDFAKLQFDVGEIDQTNVLRAEVELINQQQSLLQAEVGYKVALASFRSALNIPYNLDVELSEEMAVVDYSILLDDAIAIAVKNRPELRQAAIALKQADEQIKQAVAGKYPNLAFQYQYEQHDDRFPGIAQKNENWNALLTLTYSIWDSGITDGQIEQAKSAYEIAIQKLTAEKNTVITEVQEAYFTMMAARSQIENNKKGAIKAEEDVSLVDLRYAAGIATMIDVVDAQNALTKARTNYSQSIFHYNDARAKLEKAMGVNL